MNFEDLSEGYLLSHLSDVIASVVASMNGQGMDFPTPPMPSTFTPRTNYYYCCCRSLV